MAERTPGPPTLATRLAAIGSEPRLGILAELASGPLHVSELARRAGMSRQLLYLHLAKLEQAGFVHGTAGTSEEGQTVKLYRLEDFSLLIDIEAILESRR